MVLISGDYLTPSIPRFLRYSPDFTQGPLLEKIGPTISGGIGKYMVGANGRPTGFMIRNVSMPKNLDVIDSIYGVDGSPLLLTRKDTDWIEPNACFLVGDVEYEMLRGDASWKQYASTSELITQLRMNQLSDSHRIACANSSAISPSVHRLYLVAFGNSSSVDSRCRHVF